MIKNSKGEYLEYKYPERNVRKAGGSIPLTNFLYAPGMKDPEIERDVITSEKGSAADDEVVVTCFSVVTERLRALKFHMLTGGLKNECPVEAIPVLTILDSAGDKVLVRNNSREISTL